MEIFGTSVLDVRTLAFVILIFTFLMAILMAFLQRSAPHIPGPRYWFKGSLSIGIGLLIFGLYPMVNDFAAFSLAGTFIVAGIYLYLAGIWRFKGKPIDYRLVVGFPALQLLQSSFFLFVYPDAGLRMLGYSLMNVIYGVLILREMLDAPSGKLRTIFQINAVNAGAHIVVMLLRGYFSVVGGFSPVGPSVINMVVSTVGSLSQVVCIFCFLLMVTLRLAEEYEMQIKNRDRFFNIIAHDLKGPVGTILSFLRMMNEEKNVPRQEQKFYMAELEKLSGATLHLIQNLLEWSRKQTGHYTPSKEPLELRRLLTENVEFLRTLARAKNIEITLPQQNELTVQADRQMLETVIRNVVSNSIKFTPERGRIMVDYRPNARHFQLTVKDTGIGMTEEKLKNIFSLGGNQSTTGTLGESGSGLGLIICKEFLERNGGSIAMRSKPGEGTETIIRLPLN